MGAHPVRNAGSLTVVLDASAPKQHVSLARACVEQDGREVELSNREMELVMYLAAHQRHCRSERIVEALWPEGEGSTGCLRVNVLRARSRLGTGAIVCARDGYGLAPHVAIDLETIERATLQARHQRNLDDALRSELESLLEGLAPPRSSRCDSWAWFAPVRSRIDDLTREVVTLLGRDALAAGNVEAALTLGQRIISIDPCDEPARELRIRAHVAAGDRGAAFREFRTYREILESELGAKPSADLAALLHGRPA
jgi:DNA-binding SARP family transcriptional activator